MLRTTIDIALAPDEERTIVEALQLCIKVLEQIDPNEEQDMTRNVRLLWRKFRDQDGLLQAAVGAEFQTEPWLSFGPRPGALGDALPQQVQSLISSAGGPDEAQDEGCGNLRKLRHRCHGRK